MDNKSSAWGKFFLSVALLAVTVQGLFLIPMVKENFFSIGDPRDETLNSAWDSSITIENRLVFFRGLVYHLNLFQDPIYAGSISKEGFRVLEIVDRCFPNLIWKIKFRLAKKERVNVERKIEKLDIILYGIERDLYATGVTRYPALSEAQKVEKLQKLELIRHRLLMYRVDLESLSESLDRVKNNRG